jgi:hypothetical protein
MPSVRPVPYVARRALPGVAAICVLVLSASCGDTDITQTTAPDPVRCDIALDPARADVPFTAGEVKVTLRTDRDCLWTAATTATWLAPSPTAGQGDGTLTVRVSENTQQTARTATVTVNAKAVEIAQAAAPAPLPPCSYALAPPGRVFGDRGGTGVLEVITNSSCEWSATTSSFWLTVTSQTSGTGPATVTYSVQRNFGRLSRTGTITIAGQQHVVVQSGLLDVRSSGTD